MILQLLRFLPDGRQAKTIVDRMIHLSGTVTNLLKDLAHAYREMEAAHHDEKRKMFARRVALGLKRYFFLICFNQYLTSCREVSLVIIKYV